MNRKERLLLISTYSANEVLLRNALCVGLRRLRSLLRLCVWRVTTGRADRPARIHDAVFTILSVILSVSRPYWCRLEELLMHLLLLISRSNGKLLFLWDWTLKLHSSRRRLAWINTYSMYMNVHRTRLCFAATSSHWISETASGHRTAGCWGPL